MMFSNVISWRSLSLTRLRLLTSSQIYHQRHASSVAHKRVLGAVAHINSGKTTTSEAMLFAAGALKRMGNVDVGDTKLDFLPAERERGITINAAAISFNWRNHQFFLVDSPGHLDFTFEVERALKVMDGVVVLLDAVAGVQPQTETVWRQADSNNLARVVFINKMDRDGADFQKTLASIKNTFDVNPVITHVPIFDGYIFKGIFDLLERFDENSLSGAFIKDDFDNVHELGYEDLTPAQKECVDAAVEELTENVAEVDDFVMEKWMEGEKVSKGTIIETIRKATILGTLIPVACGSSLKGIGVESLMDSIVRYLPSPVERGKINAKSKKGDSIEVIASTEEPFLAYAFKVTYDKHRGRMVHLRAFSGELNGGRKPFLNTTKGKPDSPSRLVQIQADKFVDVESIGTGDIFAAVGLKHTETGDTLILRQAPKKCHVVLDGVKAPPAVFSVAVSVASRSNEKQLDEALRQLIEEDCSLELKTDEETEETILSGMGELHLEVVIDRLKRSLPFELQVSKPRVAYRESISAQGDISVIVRMDDAGTPATGSLDVSIESGPDTSIEITGCDAAEKTAIREGLVAALEKGPTLGAPVRDVCIKVSAKDVDSADDASLRACGAKAIRKLLPDCAPILMEPIMTVEVVVPDGNTGDIVSELSHPTRRRGMIEGIDSVGVGMSRINALVPLEGVLGWATKMRSLTKGRGDLMISFHSYREVDEVVKARLAEREEEEENA